MVGLRKVVVYCFRNAHDMHFSAAFFGISGKFCRGVHGIVAADIEEISDVVLLKKRKDLFVERIVHVCGQLFSARTESRGGCAFKRKNGVLIFQNGTEIDKIFFEKSLDSVFHSVDIFYVLIVAKSEKDPCKRCVYRAGRPSRLPDNGVSFNHCVILLCNNFRCQLLYIPTPPFFQEPKRRLYGCCMRSDV